MTAHTDYSTETDHKDRFGRILEIPYVSKIQRHCLDGFKVRGIKEILKPIEFETVLDVGCGYAEYATLNKGIYFGLDNCFSRVKFANQRYADSYFVQADAGTLSFKDGSFEAVLMANTAHHLSDQVLSDGIQEMQRVSSRYVIIDDCIKTAQQSPLSQYFYSLDRGTMFRTIEQFEEVFDRFNHLKLIIKDTHVTFPGLYTHAIFVLEKK